MSNCPPGYVDDLWFNPSLDVQTSLAYSYVYVLGNNKCSLPIESFTIVLDCLTALDVIIFLILFYRMAILPRSNRIVLTIYILNCFILTFHLALCQTIGRYGFNVSFPLLGVVVFFLQISVLLTVHQVIKTIPTIFSVSLSLGNNSIFGKSRMIQVNTILCIISAFIVVISWAFLIPSTSDPRLVITFFKIGGIANIIAALTQATIGYRSLDILIQMINDTNQSRGSEHKDTLSDAKEIVNSNSKDDIGVINSEKKSTSQRMEEMMKKFRRFQLIAIGVALSSVSIWILQMFVLPMHFYIGLYHVMIIYGFLFAVFSMFKSERVKEEKKRAVSQTVSNTGKGYNFGTDQNETTERKIKASM